MKERGFDAIYVDVAHRDYIAYTDVKEIVERIGEVVADVAGYTPIKLA